MVVCLWIVFVAAVPAAGRLPAFDGNCTACTDGLYPGGGNGFYCQTDGTCWAHAGCGNSTCNSNNATCLPAPWRCPVALDYCANCTQGFLPGVPAFASEYAYCPTILPRKCWVDVMACFLACNPIPCATSLGDCGLPRPPPAPAPPAVTSRTVLIVFASIAALGCCGLICVAVATGVKEGLKRRRERLLGEGDASSVQE